MRTNKCTLVTLDTVVGIPYGNKACYTTLLVSRSALLPCAVLVTLEGADRKVGSVLGIDGTNKFGDVLGFVVNRCVVGRKVSPCGVNCQYLIFTTTIDSCEVHVHNVFALLAV